MDTKTLGPQSDTPLAPRPPDAAEPPWWAAPTTIVRQTPPAPAEAAEPPWWAASTTLALAPTESKPGAATPAAPACPRKVRHRRLVFAWLLAGVLGCVVIGIGIVSVNLPDDAPDLTTVAQQEEKRPQTHPLSLPAKKPPVLVQAPVPPKQADPPPLDPPPDLDDPPEESPAPDPPPVRELPPPKFVGPPKPLVKPPVNLDRPPAPELAKLIEALQAPTKAERLAALKALGNYGHAARKAVPAIAALLRAKDNDLGNRAALTLTQIGSPAVPALVRALTDKNGTVRHRAISALSLIGPEAGEAVHALANALADPNEKVRALAVTALGEIGPSAQPACTALVRALGDPSLLVQTQTIQALRQLGPAIVGPLCQALVDKDANVRLAAVQALCLLGPEAKDAVPQLVEAVKDEDQRVRLAALQALGWVGPNAEAALPGLLAALQTPHQETQVQAYLAMRRIAAKNPQKLADLLRHVSNKTRWAQPFTLPQFGPRSEDAVQPLLRQLTDADPQNRAMAALGLGRLGTHFGPDAYGIARALLDALNDPVPMVQTSAYVAMGHLFPGKRQIMIKAMQQGLTHADELVQAAQERLAYLNGNGPLLNPAALKDAQLQGYYDRIVNMFLIGSNLNNCTQKECESVDPIQGHLLECVKKLGPAAVPALVRGINRVGLHQVGFT